MHISVYAHILQANEIVFDTRLVKPLGNTGVKNAVIGALGGDRENLNVLEVHKLMNWLLLEIDANIQIRNDQVDVALATISPASQSNSVLQMNMGQGKLLLPHRYRRAITNHSRR